MDNEPAVIRVPSPRRRGPSLVVVVAAAVVGLALLKPWAFGAGPEQARVAVASVPVTPALTPSPAPLATTVAIWDPNAMACMSSEGNRVLALLRAPGEEVRTWLTLDDLDAANPLDPAVVPLRLPSSHVVGLGVCARRIVAEEDVTSAAQLVDIALVSAGSRPTLMDLGAPVILSRQVGVATLGVLYGPPPALVGAPGSPGASPEPADPIWPVGNYAIGYRFVGDPPTMVRWVRLDILAASGKYG